MGINFPGETKLPGSANAGLDDLHLMRASAPMSSPELGAYLG